MVKTLMALFVMGSLAASPFDSAFGLAHGRQEKAPNCNGCGKENFGTTIQWMGTPSDAAAKAKKEEKLVFVLHVSGYFEDPKFT